MNVRELLTELGIPYREAGAHHHVRTGNLGIDCPHCSPHSGRFRLSIHVHKLYCNCWVCGTHRLGESLAAATDRPLREILPLLPDSFTSPRRIDDPSTGRYTPPPDVGPLQATHRRYLTDRGFDPDELSELWGVGGIGLSGMLKFRIFIPVFDNGVPASWTTRAVGNRVGRRYVSAPPEAESRPLKSLLYGEAMVRHAMVVTEGPADAWAVGPGAVATFGVVVTQAQVARIARRPVRVVVFDSEPAAQRRADALIDKLACHAGTTYKVTLTGHDPASSPRSELRELRKRFLE